MVNRLGFVLPVLLVFVGTRCVGGSGDRRPSSKLKLGIPLVDLVEITGPGTSCRRSPYGPGDYRRSIRVDGRDRFYEVHVPQSYEKSRPSPLVLAFHGGGGQPTAMRWWSRMDRTSDASGFIVVYTAGTGRFKTFGLTFNAGGCCGYAMQHRVDDVAYTKAVLDDVAKFFCIDPKRVYAAGYSNGAQMCYRLACELSDRIAAVASVGAPMTNPKCKPSRPLSVIHFMGLKDRAVAYKGGLGEKGVENTGFSHISAAENIAFWVAHDKCASRPAREWTISRASFTLYGPGEEGTEVIYCAIEDGGHTWPGGDRLSDEGIDKVGQVNRDISASDIIWEFFKRHPMK